MKKYYCDCCGKELKHDEQAHRITRELDRGGHRLHVEILTGIDGTSNAGDFCHACVLDAVNKGGSGRKPTNE